MTGPVIPQDRDLATRLLQASHCLDRRDPRAALLLLAPLLARKPSPETCMLAGAAHRMLGALPEAEAMFRRSLALDPAQANLQVSLGQLLRVQSRFADSAKAFRAALKLEPENLKAHLGLAGTLQNAGDPAGAERAYRNLLQFHSDNIEARQALGLLLNLLDRTAEGEEILQSALILARGPGQKAGVEHALAVCATRRNALAEALAHLDVAHRLNSASSRVDQDRAAILQRLYRDDDARTILDGVVRRDPGNLDAHHALNQILYRLGDDAAFLSSYDKAAALLPGHVDLVLAKARFLLAANRFAQAGDIFAAALKADDANRHAATGLLTALRSQKEFDAAIAVGEKALQRFPGDVDLAGGVAAALLCKGEPLEAQRYISRALSSDPHHQGSLSLQGLAWRLSGDPRDDVLHDYENQIRVYDLPPPAGYSSMQAFNEELNAMLDSLHPPVREYVDQSLRHGTQTVGNIFGAGHDLVERLKARIAEAIQDYIAAMPDDTAHPYYGRRTKDFRFAGSWSSRLRNQGFHASHIHAEGWISSCYYVALPDVIADAQNRPGWIEFGRPSYDIGLQNPVRRAVQPGVGKLVLFASYMLHGTVPFQSAQDRTTIAFDVIPA